MMIRKNKRRILCGICTVIVGWVGLVLIFPDRTGSRANAEIAQIEHDLSPLAKQSFSEEELQMAISRIPVQGRTNEYKAELRFESPTDWKLVLKPKRRVAYSNPYPFWKRLFLLRFKRTTFPDLVVTSKTTGCAMVPGQE